MIAIYRIGVHIPLPGVNPSAMSNHPELAQNLLGMIDAALAAFSSKPILSMGIGPYITASIIMQLMSVVFPKLEELQKHSGEQGRRQLQQITHYATVGLARVSICYALQAAPVDSRLKRQTGRRPRQPPAVRRHRSRQRGHVSFASTLILAASALAIMWIGELITERGVGNGASLLIFLGIASRLPVMIRNTYESVQSGQTTAMGVFGLVAVFLVLIALVVALQQGVRKIMVLGARRNVGRQVMKRAR